DLDVQDLDLDAGAAADLDGLGNGGEHIRSLVADVGDVDTAVLRDDLAQLDDLIRSRDGAGRHGEHAGKPGRPLLHRLLDQRLHLLKLIARRPGVRLAHDAFPDVAQADEGGDVDRDAGALDEIEVAADGGPGLALAFDFDARRRALALVGADG